MPQRFLPKDSYLPLNAVRVNGYPELETILAFYDSIPVLLDAVRRHCPEELAKWEEACRIERPERLIQTIRPVPVEYNEDRASPDYDYRR